MLEVGYVINLDGSPDRLAHASAQLENAGLGLRRVAAVDGRSTPVTEVPGYDADRTMRFMGRGMTQGELGCYQSHVAALKAFLSDGAEIGLILEDDFQFALEGPGSLKTLVEWLSAQSLDWHAINLGANKSKIATPLADIGGNRLVRAHYFPMLAHAMLWSRRGAEAFLDVAYPIFCPADNMYRHVLTRSDKGLAFYPAIASAGAFDSDISARSGGSRSAFGRSRLYGFRKQRRLWTEKRIARANRKKRRV